MRAWVYSGRFTYVELKLGHKFDLNFLEIKTKVETSYQINMFPENTASPPSTSRKRKFSWPKFPVSFFIFGTLFYQIR